MTETIVAIAASSATAALAVAVVVLAVKLGAVTPALVEYGKAQVQAEINQHAAEDERDQEKALREQIDLELKDALAKLKAAETALAACGVKESKDVETKIAGDATAASALGDLNAELHAPVSAGGSDSTASDAQRPAGGATVPAAATAGRADGGKSTG